MEKIISDEPKIVNRIYNIIKKVEEDDDYELSRQLMASAITKKVIIEVYELYFKHLAVNNRILAKLFSSVLSKYEPGKAVDVNKLVTDQFVKIDNATIDRYNDETFAEVFELCRNHLKTIDEK